MNIKIIPTLVSFLCLSLMTAQKTKDEVLKKLELKKSEYGTIAQNIWQFAEMGYQEEKSSALLQNMLSEEGFSIKKGVAGIPTAFIAEYGSGSPIIAIFPSCFGWSI